MIIHRCLRVVLILFKRRCKGEHALILFKRRYKGEHVSCIRLDLSVQFFFLEAKMEAVSYVRVVVVVVFISSQEKNFLSVL